MTSNQFQIYRKQISVTEVSVRMAIKRLCFGSLGLKGNLIPKSIVQLFWFDAGHMKKACSKICKKKELWPLFWERFSPFRFLERIPGLCFNPLKVTKSWKHRQNISIGKDLPLLSHKKVLKKDIIVYLFLITEFCRVMALW